MMSRNWVLAFLCLTLCCGVAHAQGFGFDDNFVENPFDSGDWIANGLADGVLGPVAGWVPPPGDTINGAPCIDPNLPIIIDPDTLEYDCSVYDEGEVEPDEFGGYILVTPGQFRYAGNAFRAEADAYDSFKMTVVVELRNGTVGQPADGMVVVVVGTDGPPDGTGTGGGGMGAPCVGTPDTAPMLAWEFDNWSCNTGDDNNDNHLAFSYSPVGFPCTDAIQPDVKVEIDPAIADFHNQQDYLAGPVEANRYKMTVFAQNCGGELTVATDLEALDFNGGINLGRIFTHVVPNFEPFDGYLGVTASTGDAHQNHILHSASLEALPDGFCLQPVAEASRSIAIDNLPQDVCGDFEGGSQGVVTITLANVRAGNECCDAASQVTIEETVPSGWATSAISDGGSRTGDVITWDLTGADVSNGKEVSYGITAPGAANAIAAFSGIINDGEGGVDVFISGDAQLYPHASFDACGRIKCWNILGAITQGGGAAPGQDAIRGDYLTDGVVGESEFVFEPGATISPDFFGNSAGTGIFLDPNNRNPDALNGTAEVFKYVDNQDGLIDYNNVVFGGAPDNVMAYAQIYVESDEEREVYIACDSDDAIQIILNEQEVWINDIARGNTNLGCPAGLILVPRNYLVDVTPFPVTLLEGENRLIVKTFEGGGDFNFEVRFEDELENPVTEGITFSHVELNPTCRTPAATITREIDTGHPELGGSDTWSKDDLGSDFDVSLTISNVREASGICDDAGMVTITETVPLEWTPLNASDGGTIRGNVIEWSVRPSDGASVTYQVSPDGTLADMVFSGTVQEDGSATVSSIKGEKDVLYAPSPFGREPGTEEELVSTGFDGEAGLCPDGWTCNEIGTGLHTATVVDVATLDGNEERVRLACAGDGVIDGATCGDRATNIVWTDPVDLSSNSFSAEFDVFLSHPDPLTQAPADALTFFVLDADDPLTAIPNVIGAQGGANGLGGLTGFAVEFDLWQNPDPSEPSGFNVAGLDYVHVAATKDGIVTPHVQTHHDLLGPNAFPQRLGGAGWPEMVDVGGTGIPIHCEVDYNNGNLQVWIEAPETNFGTEPAYPRTKVLDTIVTFNTVGGIPVDPAVEDPVLKTGFLGFSASTGGAVITADVDNVDIVLYPATDRPVEICDNGTDDDGDTLADCDDPDCEEECKVEGVPFIRGDSTGDGVLNITDPVKTLGSLFLGDGPLACDAAADATNDGALNITDPVRVLGSLFLGDGPLAPPNACADGPNADPAFCLSYPFCER